ncbi:MAG: RNA polymerase sigma factor [Flavobacteriales bacterium]|nr:RNA polymerase sigma factor [Bacteroidota bacterium]MCB9240228.1 RNA polymerase sigma factor [Flavobacteriales bacterium]
MYQGIDHHVLQQCLQGKERGFSALYQSLFSYLMNICIRYHRDYDEAGLALNEIFLKIADRLSDYEVSRPFLPWVKTIAINHLIDRYRSHHKNRQLDMVDDDISASNLDIQVPADTGLQADDLIRMIRELPEPEGHIFNLFAIDGYSHPEISQLLNLPVGTTKWYVSRARKRLQAMLMEEEQKVSVSK